MTYSMMVGKYKLIFSDTHFKDFRKKPTISVYDADTNSETKIASFNSQETFEWFIEAVVEADRKTENSSENPNNFAKDINVRSKTEPSFKVDGIGDDDSTIHAIAHLQKVGWLQEHDRALTEPQTEAWHDDCNTCRWHACTIPCCDYEPMDEPQIVSLTSAHISGDIYHKVEDEPEIDGAIDEARFKAHCMNCQRDVADIKCLDCDGDKYFIKDEPQTDCSWR